MSLSATKANICFINLHENPTEHFTTLTKHLSAIGTIDIYTTELAEKNLKEKGINPRRIFPTENLSPQGADSLAEAIAVTCLVYSAVITDISHPFASKIQQSLTLYRIRHLTYDNNVNIQDWLVQNNLAPDMQTRTVGWPYYLAAGTAGLLAIYFFRRR